MKDNRIATSFDKVNLPIDREDALLTRILMEAEQERASLEKEQEMNMKSIRNTESSTKRSNCTIRKRWPLVLVACFLLTITLVACIPEARAEVLAWLGKVFNVQSYMGEESRERSPEPKMDAIIKPIADAEREIIITEVYDSDEARAMAESFDVRLDEIAYTGNSVLVTGWFTGACGKSLLDPYTGGDTWHADNEFTSGDMILTLSDGTVCQ